MPRALKLLLSVALALVASLSSCECRKEPPPLQPNAIKEPDTKSKLDDAAGKLRRPTRTPKDTPAPEPTATPPSSVPADFPSEVPVPEGSTLMKAMPMANEAHNVIFSVRDSVKNVTSFYENKLKAEGFQQTQQIPGANRSFATYKKGELLVNVTIVDDERSPGQQIIAIMYEREKALPFDEF